VKSNRGSGRSGGKGLRFAQTQRRFALAAALRRFET
jgi:hypothetical protein